MRLTRRTTITKSWALASLALGGMIALSGCHTDMWAQPKLRPNGESDFFADQQASRPLVPHTVAQGGLRRQDDAFFTGYQTGKPISQIPARAVQAFGGPGAMLERGQDRYNTYCSPCHGATGDGNGMITQRGKGYWQKLPASYHTNRLRKIGDGHFYKVLTEGQGVMYGYASRIQDVNDRWAVVAYIRALQLSRAVPSGQAPAGALEQINRGGGRVIESPAGDPPANSQGSGDGGFAPGSPMSGTLLTKPENRTEGGSAAPGAGNLQQNNGGSPPGPGGAGGGGETGGGGAAR